MQNIVLNDARIMPSPRMQHTSTVILMHERIWNSSIPPLSMLYLGPWRPWPSTPLSQSPSSLDRFERICSDMVVSTVSNITYHGTSWPAHASIIPNAIPAVERGRVLSRMERITAFAVI